MDAMNSKNVEFFWIPRLKYHKNLELSSSNLCFFISIIGNIAVHCMDNG
jgi:hypothetical protein